MAEKETKVVEAHEIVQKYMLASIGVGLIPIPLVDVAAVAAIQLKMLHHVSRLYGVEFSENRAKSIVAALLGGGVPVSVSLNLVSALKSLPIVGLVVGIFGTAILGGASTYAIGKVFIQHFESGGNFLTLDPQKLQDYYGQQVEVGKAEIKSSVGIKP